MLIYGINKTPIAKGVIKEVCGSCLNDTDFMYQIYSNYMHFFFIPTFPVRKEIVVVCTHCKTPFKEGNINNEFKNKIRSKQQLSTPKWHRLGLVIFPILLFLLVRSCKSDNVKVQAAVNLTKMKTDSLFKQPQIGDKYEIKTVKDIYNFEYQAFKIDEIRKEGFKVSKFPFTSNKALNLAEMNRDSFYILKDFIFTDSLTSYKNADRIVKIIR